MREEKIALADLQAETGISVSAGKLTPLGELRLRISLPNGGKIVILHSEEGNRQDGARFDGVDDELELVVVQDGSMQMATPDADGSWIIANFGKGAVAHVDPRRTHATHPAKGSWIVGVMTGDWRNAKRIADPAFDEQTRELTIP